MDSNTSSSFQSQNYGLWVCILKIFNMQVTLTILQTFANIIRHDIQYISQSLKWHCAPNFVNKCSDLLFRIIDSYIRSKTYGYLMCQVLCWMLESMVSQNGTKKEKEKGTVPVLISLYSRKTEIIPRLMWINIKLKHMVKVCGVRREFNEIWLDEVREDTLIWLTWDLKVK